MSATALPDLDRLDLEALKALLIAQHERYTATLTSRASEIERLVLLVEKLQRMLFGAKSEKVLRQIERLELQPEDLQLASAIEEAEAVPPAEHHASAKPFRRPLPEHLPREVHTHLPGHEACPDCGGRLRELGEDVAEMLEYVRSSFKVLRHVRPQAELRCLRPHRAGCGAFPTHRPRTRRAGTARACAGVEICRSSAALSAV